jgi:hypothetical protein
MVKMLYFLPAVAFGSSPWLSTQNAFTIPFFKALTQWYA